MNTERKVTVTIGRSGTKRHPAKISDLLNGDGSKRGESVICTCGCPHTNSGFKRPNVVNEGWEAVNCGGQK